MGREPRALDDAGTERVKRVAVVTGASRGLGRACAIALADGGWTVAVGYRSNETDAKETVAAIESGGSNGMAVYLRAPNYVNNLLRHGFSEQDVRDGGSDRLVDEIVTWGDEQAIAAQVAAHHAAGADHVCLQPLRVDLGAPPTRELAELAKLL